jgi:hypothetical protein
MIMNIARSLTFSVHLLTQCVQLHKYDNGKLSLDSTHSWGGMIIMGVRGWGVGGCKGGVKNPI